MRVLTTERIIKFLVGVAVAALIVFLVWYFSSVVIYLLVSAILAVMFRPLVSKITSIRIRGRAISRGIAALVSLLTIWVIFAFVIALLLPLVSSKMHELSSLNLSEAFRSIEEPLLDTQHYIQGLLSIPESDFSLSDAIVKGLRSFVDLDMVNSAFASILHVMASFVISFFSISFITFFFLKDDGLFNNMISALFPSKYIENVDRALSSISYLLSRYFVGILGESLIVFVLMSLSMICFGMKSSDAIFMGLIMGVLNVIPYAGPCLGAIASICLAVISPIDGLTVGETITIIVCTIMVLKGADDFILQPTLYSSRVKAHPLEIFIVILLSGYVAGVVGMLLAIPSYTVLRVFAKEFLSQFSLVRRLTDKI